MGNSGGVGRRRVRPAALVVACGALLMAACGARALGGDGGPFDGGPPDAGPGLDVIGDPCWVFDPPCPAPPSPTQFSICGRVHDVETSEAVFDAESASLHAIACEPIGWALSGDCSPVIAMSPLDTCGWFQLVGFSDPGSGFVAVLIDDDEGAADDHIPTATVYPLLNPGAPRAGDAWSTRQTTNTAWNTSAAAGVDFGVDGAVLLIFQAADGTPMSGVTVSVGGMAEPPNDFYFSDTDPLIRRTIDPAMTSTGPNGSVMFINSALHNMSGTGGCEWPSQLGASVPGAVVVQVHRCP